jgi:signal transduction histidine kinase/CheY-like chemotaxis protein
MPLTFEGQVKGVRELASFEGFNPTHEAFLDQLTESISIVLNTIQANMRTEDLLKQSQSLAQQLQTRQEQLQNTNEELQEKARLLAHQNQEVEKKNQEVEQARQALEEKAKQLALTSKYKSEFLANMSHELRTPLNSLLILSDQLCKNPEGNLSSKQLDFAKTIHSSGNELLMLINDILDLSRIESGTVVVDASELRLDDLQNYIERTFRHVADSKNLDFLLRFDPQLPRSVITDTKRLQQIIKNLLSNAFKFTHHGQVTLTVEPAKAGWNAENDELNRASEVLALAVSDTGIGIPSDKQQIIFEAFQQADGSTSRKYGGTGLGLAISRELSRLLGGEIRLVSSPGRGSTFVLYLPAVYTPRPVRKAVLAETQVPLALAAGVAAPAGVTEASRNLTIHDQVELASAAEGLVNEAGDDRDDIRPGDKVLLIIENDIGFARFLLDAAREKGFKGLVTSLGAVALAMTREYKPDAITLDIYLPDIAGWRVLERLKNDIATRHVPVCVVSTDESRDRALASGALAFLAKPIQSRDVLDALLDYVGDFIGRTMKSLLVIEPDGDCRNHILNCIDADDVQVTAVPDAAAALQMLRERRTDCVIAGADVPDLASTLLAAGEAAEPAVGRLPIILFGDGAAHPDGTGEWKRLADTCTVNRVHSTERLLDLTSFFLHLPVANLPESQRHLLLELHQSDKLLAGKKVLIVDDDMRNIFALSTLLEEHEMVISSADNGRDAIRILRGDPAIDIVLMDIMMPEMDGLETMREIRKNPTLKNLPIVAVTAKAMKGDREKCIEAGAWDYLSKPVDTEQMLAVLRAWLHR